MSNKRKTSDIFLDRLRKLLKSGTVTIPYLVKKTGISKVALYAFKKGEYLPRLDNAEIIANACGYEFSHFISAEPPAAYSIVDSSDAIAKYVKPRKEKKRKQIKTKKKVFHRLLKHKDLFRVLHDDGRAKSIARAT